MKTLETIEDENIVKCEEIFEDENYFWVVMEYCDEDLGAYLNSTISKGGLLEDEVKTIFA